MLGGNGILHAPGRTHMKPLVPLLALSLAACGSNPHPTLAIGSAAPDFALPGIDGRIHTLSEYSSARVLVVVFTCNHCPASQLYESRLKKLDEDYRRKGVTVIAINPDNPSMFQLGELGYTDVTDSLADMKVRAAQRHLAYPYLYDGGSQAAASAFGAATTPQVFVFDRNLALRYQGRIDDNLSESLVRVHDAREAIEALLAERPVVAPHTTAVGCPVKWLSTPSERDAELARVAAEPVTLEIAGPDVLKKLRANGTGKLLLVNFWATWCGPCVAEFPDLEDTYRMYRGRTFQFVSVSENDPAEKAAVLEFLQKHHASNSNLLFATPDTYGLQAAFDPQMPAAVPFTLVIAPNGDVVYQELGTLEIVKLRRAILANLPEEAKYRGLQAYWSGN
jgi:thiol-disulfide isomerase/thioredoxin